MLSADFTAVVARAKGLASHLFTRSELESLAGLDAASLVRQLSRSPRLWGPLDERASLRELDHASRRTARHHLLTLARWEGSAPALGVFWAEQDRRSLRAMLRGALSSATAEERLSGLISTPTLPERVLGELARQPTPAGVVSVLFAVGHPLAARLLPLTAQKQPDLLALEQALMQGWAEWATREAKRGDLALRRFVEKRIDVMNAQAAVVLREAKDVAPEGWFIDRPGLSELVEDGPTAEGKTRRSRPGLPKLVEASPGLTLSGERETFVATMDALRAQARIDPLSSVPLLYFLLRLEAQVRDLRRLACGAALSAPAALVKAELVTPGGGPSWS